ncbi:MAG: hypothetical protein U0M41_04465 [Negativibacillus sp.]|nr:hypothetical protein [Negativibacillus sp.]
MKKVLSVALASAMVLGMGANAFAISYNSSTNDEASWPKNFRFEGQLFVTNKDGDIVEDASTDLTDNKNVDFEPGDVIWMPLYADHQKVYETSLTEGKDDIDAQEQHKVAEASVDTNEKWCYYAVGDKNYNSSFNEIEGNPPMAEGFKEWLYVGEETITVNKEEVKAKKYIASKLNVPEDYKADKDKGEKDSYKKYYIGTKTYKDYEAWKAALTVENGNDAYITIRSNEVEGTADEIGKPIWNGKYEDDTVYTGNIDKNWSINLIEGSSTEVEELVAKAELYKATAADYHSYKGFADDIVPNGVYVKITLKDSWKFVDEETVKYYVYVASNKTGDETNKVWVEGNYANNDFEYVDFTWTNDASKAKLWKVKKGENGDAVFDFADKAFFTVKMYSEESMYLDLSTAYNKAVAGEMDVEADSFFKFDNENANFSRTGTLLIASDDESLVPYSIEDGELVKVDAEYVENYAIAHTNKKVNGFVFKTKQLGNYVLATEEIAEEVEPEDDEKPAEENKPAEEVKPDTKPNPETGAEDFVGLAVSLAVVSVAAAGALALKK